MDIDEVGHAEGVEVVAPDMLGQCKSGYRSVFIMHEELQDGEFPGGEGQQSTVTHNFSADGIELNMANLNYWIGRGGAPEKCPYSGHEFGYGKRFGEVVVGAKV